MTITSDTRVASPTVRTATGAAVTPGGTLFLVAQTSEPCGVEVFTRKLVDALAASDPAGGYAAMPVSARWRDLPAAMQRVARAKRVVFGLPLVAWKRTLVIPLLLLLTARITGRRTAVFLHEWSALHWLRRLAFAPFVALSDTIVLLSPYVQSELADDRFLSRATRKCRLVPHPPTIAPPPQRTLTNMVQRVEAAGKDFDVVIGYFGAIYKGKAPDALLDICDSLRRRGTRAAIVFIGSFMKSLDGYEAEFRARVKALALEDRVIVTGYVETEAELFALFERIGAFLFLFPEGMTARRSSVIACLQSNRPVIVTAAQSRDEFRHHQGLTALIDSGALSFVPRSAGVAEIAERLLAAAGQERQVVAIDAGAWWQATTNATRAVL